MDPNTNPEQHEGSGEFADYRFWVETSRDQITGNMWGHAIVHETLWWAQPVGPQNGSVPQLLQRKGAMVSLEP